MNNNAGKHMKEHSRNKVSNSRNIVPNTKSRSGTRKKRQRGEDGAERSYQLKGVCRYLNPYELTNNYQSYFLMLKQDIPARTETIHNHHGYVGS